MTDAELARLDVFEGVASAPRQGVYRRAAVSIRMRKQLEQKQEEEEGDQMEEVVEGIMYIANNMAWQHPPSEQYLTAIHVMLRGQRGSAASTGTRGWSDEDASLRIVVRGILGGSAHQGGGGGGEGGDHSHSECDKDGVSAPAGTSAAPVATALYEWRHPGTHSLSLPAVCVEVNALLPTATAWVMPATIREILVKLRSVDIHSSAQLCVHLLTADARGELNRTLEAAGHSGFHESTLLLFKQVILGV